MKHAVRVVVGNPGRASRKGKAMAKRRKRIKHRKKSNPTRKKSHRKKYRRRHASNPKRSHKRRRTHKRTHARKRRRSHARRFKANPRHKRTHARRRRRNPGGKLPGWAQIAIAGTLAVAGYAAVGAGAYALTQRLDPSMQTHIRNRYILSGLGLAGGIYLAKKKPLLGVALAGGALAAVFGPMLALKLGEFIDKPSAVSKQGLGEVFATNLQGYQSMQGYSSQMGSYAPQLGMGEVFGQSMGAVYGQSMGAFAPAATPPWQQSTPFG